MPEIYTELTDPTAVNAALYLSFTSPTAQNLVIAKTSLLQIFSITTIETELEGSSAQPGSSSSLANGNNGLQEFDRRIQDADQEQTFLGGDFLPQRSQREPVTKLILVAEYHLSGTLTSMVKIRTVNSKNGGECLLLGFQDAKLSLVQWDPAVHGISTISVHYFEQEDFRSPLMPDVTVNYLTVDPMSRCAVLKFNKDMLAVLRFRQREDEDLVLGDVDREREVEEDEGEYDPDELFKDEDEGKKERERKEVLSGTNAAAGDAEAAAKAAAVPFPKPDQTGYPSFVVSAVQLDDQISHITSITFLYEYREPTFGILFQPKRTWSGLLECDRKDTHSYIVITLDLEQHASTPIISVTNLPYDCYRIVPLPTPIGGALLMGGNQLIHVDQAGKTTGVAVNTYARKTTNFQVGDQSDLALELEGALVEPLEGERGDVLIITKKGETVILSFKMDGRNVSGLIVTKLASPDNKEQPSVFGVWGSCIVSLGSRRLFVGSMTSDSKLIGWKHRGEKQTGGENIKEEVVYDEDQDEYAFDDMDDLYGGSDDKKTASTTNARGFNKFQAGPGEYIFQVHDRLTNFGPLRDVTLGRPAFSDEGTTRHKGVISDLELVSTSGSGHEGGLTVFRKRIIPNVIGRFDFPECLALWVVKARKKSRNMAGGSGGGGANKSSTLPGAVGIGSMGQEGESNAEQDYDRYLITSKAEESLVFQVKDTFDEVKGTEFDKGMSTMDVGTLGGEGRIVQVGDTEVRVYDCDLQLAQIIPMYNEETGEEPAIVKASFADPYLLLVRNDGSVMVHVCDEQTLEMEEVMLRSEYLRATKYTSGALFSAPPGVLFPLREGKKDFKARPLCFLLTSEGGLQIWDLDDTSAPCWMADHFSTLPPILPTEVPSAQAHGHQHRDQHQHQQHKLTARCEIREILVANLGDEVSKEPWLITRTMDDNIIFYKPYLSLLQPPNISDPTSTPSTSPSRTLRFLKIINPRYPTPAISPSDLPRAGVRYRPMLAIPDLGGYSAVFLPGNSPSFIIKTSKSIPRVHPLSGTAVRSLSSFHTRSAERGFVYVDCEGAVRVCLLPTDFGFDNCWSAKRIVLGEETNSLAYYPGTGSYVVSCLKPVPFEIGEDTPSGMQGVEQQNQPIDIPTPTGNGVKVGELAPMTMTGSIKLISPISWTVVDTYDLGKYEVPLVIKTVELEISEQTKERKQLVAIGTGIFRGEDVAARGCIYVFEVIEVVPEPGKPETNRKFKLVVREDVKGTVSALCGVNGFLLAAQGQKVMVRGLKEDQSLLPVAFMDMNMFVTVAKGLNGLVLFGDFMKSVSFVGFSEEPFKMTMFGKDVQRLDVVAADFLPDGNQLLFVVADAESNIHILQYDPEHPKSLAGQRLIRRAEFHAGHEIRTVTMLPRTPSQFDLHPHYHPHHPHHQHPSSPTNPSQLQIQQSYLTLLSTLTGSLAVISSLPEPLYRRLNIIQNQLISSEEHPCGLNPKGYRTAVLQGGRAQSSELLRGVLDGGFLGRRWAGLGEGRKGEVGGKAGSERGRVGGEVWSGGEGGLGYL
ncbi:CPSF A subunit region-domain-containing protein [Terfezia claveryi]|nr:CPSF A subunit region-domain-containing protein [Terfezia claveryi]